MLLLTLNRQIDGRLVVFIRRGESGPAVFLQPEFERCVERLSMFRLMCYWTYYLLVQSLLTQVRQALRTCLVQLKVERRVARSRIDEVVPFGRRSLLSVDLSVTTVEAVLHQKFCRLDKAQALVGGARPLIAVGRDHLVDQTVLDHGLLRVLHCTHVGMPV